MNKKQQVKELVKQMDGVLTRKNVLMTITNRGWGARWGEPIIEVSEGTVNQALEELVADGFLTRYMTYGHCYDYWRYEVIK